jgi:hypothetical protein
MLHDFHGEVRYLKYCLCYMLHDFHDEARDLKYCLCECYMTSMMTLDIRNIVYVNVT